MSREESVESYNGKANEGIHPISKVDMEIIELLESAVSDSTLKHIVRNWKKDQDSDIADNLREFLGDQEISSAEGNAEKSSEGVFITIKDEILGVSMINKIKKVDLYDDHKGEVYGLLFNEEPIPDKHNWLKDKVIVFDSKDERDSCLADIQTKLSEFINIIFL